MQSALNNLATMLNGVTAGATKGSFAANSAVFADAKNAAQALAQSGDETKLPPDALIAAMAMNGMTFDQIVQKLAALDAQGETNASAVQAATGEQLAAAGKEIAAATSAVADTVTDGRWAQAIANSIASANGAEANSAAPAATPAATRNTGANLAWLQPSAASAAAQAIPAAATSAAAATNAADFTIALTSAPSAQQNNNDVASVASAVSAQSAAVQTTLAQPGAAATTPADSSATHQFVQDDRASQVEQIAPGSLQRVYGVANPNAAALHNAARSLASAGVSGQASSPADGTNFTDAFVSAQGAAANTVSAATATVAAAPAAAAPQGTIAAQIATAVQSRPETAVGQQVVVALDPPDLGKVRLTLTSHQNEIQGVLKVDNPQTLHEVRREAAMLVSRLNESGLDVRKIEVVLNDPNAGQSSLQGQGGGQAWQGFGRQEMHESTQSDYPQETSYDLPDAQGELVGAGAGGLSYWV